mmetsp:Transcript_23330/g.52625  ORF Transcript_23330/g.52625 Transcript_23330/m.52625 type:complete len:109 (+) Transcript_23330:750-1076(+)
MHQDRKVTFTWPLDPKTGEEMNPFADFGFPMNEMTWELELEGRIVRLCIMGQDGPQEIVSRHPETWGWVLYSQGSVWTSWPMPRRDEEDEHLLDANLRNLPSDLRREF